MRPRIACALLSAAAAVLLPAAGTAAESGCETCHRSLGAEQAAVVDAFRKDIHREKGLTCASCHGGDPKASDAGAAMGTDDFVGAPEPAEVPAFCGKCHSKVGTMKKFEPSLPVDQERKYYTSVHGRRLRQGDSKVATCSSCHGAHSILPPSDPRSSVYPKNIPATCGRCHSDAKRMAPYRIPTDQAAGYTRSVHGRALLEKGDISAPTCNDCHGNHGAAPPGVKDIAMVCGSCHVHNMEYFQDSPMAAKWRKRKLHACATCHDAHDIRHPDAGMLSGKGSVCGRCHAPSDQGYRTGAAIKDIIDGLDAAYAGAERGIEDAEKEGMDVGEARDLLQEAKQAFFQTRTAVHSFSASVVREKAAKGLESARKAASLALKALKDFWMRRVLLGVSTLIITLLILAIHLKLKDLEG